jgi:hypothetical protein
MILDRTELIDHSQAVAMTYLEIFALERKSLDDVCRAFPVCGERIAVASRRILIQRLTIIAMRTLAGLAAPRSFVAPPTLQMHAVSAPTLEQKVDMLIDSTSVSASRSSTSVLAPLIEDRSSPIAERLSLEGGPLGGPLGGVAAETALAAEPSQLAEGAAASSGGSGADGSEGGAAAALSGEPAAAGATAAAHSMAATANGAGLHLAITTEQAPYAESGGAAGQHSGACSPPADVAAVSLDALAAMQQDMQVMHAAIGDEISRLHAALGRGRGSPPRLQPLGGLPQQPVSSTPGRAAQTRMPLPRPLPSWRAAPPPSWRLSAAAAHVEPPLAHTTMPRSTPLLRISEEQTRDTARQDSAEREGLEMLPAWARTPTPCTSTRVAGSSGRDALHSSLTV